MEEQEGIAVSVQNVYKDFLGQKRNTKTKVLENLTLSVKSGTIYSLLGSSGCGKTTLLQCILGIKGFDGGEILVYGHKTGTKSCGIPGPLVGYSPQEAALPNFLTIKETLIYHGLIFGMSKSEIKSRISFLLEFLRLPKASSLIKTLSGGELRRVSLCCAMIHKPRLMVLDEPTVGIDPLVRSNIWEHLIQLVKNEKTTIILTTHYIEEARRSDCVGVLRKGRLLCEEKPEVLLRSYGVQTLEEVVKTLCHNDHHVSANNNVFRRQESSSSMYSWSESDTTMVKIRKMSFSLYNRYSKRSRSGTKRSEPCEKKIPPIQHAGGTLQPTFWKIVLALMMNKIMRLLRYTPFTIAQLLLPIIETVIFHGVVGKSPLNVPFGLVSPDFRLLGNVSTGLPNYCAELEGNESDCFGNQLSSICTFINSIDSNYFHWLPSLTPNEAEVLIHNGKLQGWLEFPANFTYNFRIRLLFKTFVDNATLTGSEISVALDNGNALNAAIVSQRIVEGFFSFVETTVKGCGGDPRFVELPLKFIPALGEDSEMGWVRYPQPALIIVFMFILSHTPGVLQVMDKRQGLLERNFVAGIHFGHILVSSLIVDSLILFIDIGIFFTLLPLFYGMVNAGSWFTAVALVYTVCISGHLLARLLATTATHEMDVILVLLFINITHLISTGGIWPLEGIPKWYRVFCWSLPATAPIASLRAILFRGLGWDSFEVLQGFGISILWSIVFILVIALLNRRKQ